MYQEATEPNGPVSVLEKVKTCLEKVEFEDPKVRGTLTPDEEDHPEILVDANAWILSQVFLNIFDNARIAHERTSREFGKIEVTVALNGTTCVIDVADDGVGLSGADAEKIRSGERFSTWGGRGTGITAARKWLEEYGGTWTCSTTLASFAGHGSASGCRCCPPPVESQSTRQRRQKVRTRSVSSSTGRASTAGRRFWYSRSQSRRRDAPGLPGGACSVSRRTSR